MKQYGGVVPEIASREHLKGLPLAIDELLTQTRKTWKDIDWVAVTNRPGLVGALLVGVSFAKGLAFALQKPFSAFSHVEAHLFSALLAGTQGQPVPAFPWIALVVSGGHTELFRVKNALDYEWLGGTLDDAAGEAFDKVGKLLGLDYPAGPVIDRRVRTEGNEAQRKAFRFPRARTEAFHFSYSGLKTAVSLQVAKMGAISDADRLALASSAQEAILDPLVDKIKAAQTQFGISQVVVTGGVACNSRLRARLPDAYFPSPRHCSDNAAMVALLAGLYHQTGKLVASPWEITVSPFA